MHQPVRPRRNLGVALFRACAIAPPWLILVANRTTRHVDCRLGSNRTIADLTRDPYTDLQRLRRQAPRAAAQRQWAARSFTKAADTKYVKDNPALFSSNDPNTPMKRAFLAHTLMHKDPDDVGPNAWR